MRDRLIELLQNVPTDYAGNRGIGTIADYLIANDVVPVVRCKDCMNRFIKNWTKCTGRRPDDFCSDGKSRWNNG